MFAFPELSVKKIFAAMVISSTALAATASAQAAPGGGTPPAGGTAPAPNGNRGGRGDPAQYRQRMQDRIKELLGTNDEEWKALQPKIEKVQQLQRDSFAGRGGFGRGNRNGGDRPADPNAPAPSAVQTAAKDLQTALDNKSASADDLKAKLTAYREARAKSKADLTKAQDELRELLTARQESALVMLGLLE